MKYPLCAIKKNIILGSCYLYQCIFSEKEVVGTLILEQVQFGLIISDIFNQNIKNNQFSYRVITDVTDDLQKYF